MRVIIGKNWQLIWWGWPWQTSWRDWGWNRSWLYNIFRYWQLGPFELRYFPELGPPLKELRGKE